MSTKTISLSEDAYRRLKSMKKGKESFSDVVLRIGGESGFWNLAGLMTREQVDELEQNINHARELNEKIFARKMKGLYDR